MSTVWNEMLSSPSVKKLKQLAYQFKDELDELNQNKSLLNLFKRSGLKAKLKHVLDEIDYQEGRKQYANRPYSFPTIKLMVCDESDECECGKCWTKKRKNYFKV